MIAVVAIVVALVILVFVGDRLPASVGCSCNCGRYTHLRRCWLHRSAYFGIQNNGVNLSSTCCCCSWRSSGWRWSTGPARTPSAGIADPVLRRLRDRRVAVPVRRHDRLHDRAPARVPGGHPRARAGDAGRSRRASPQLSYLACPYCDQEVEKDFLLCPNCQQPPARPVPELPAAARADLERLPLLRDAGRSSARRTASVAPAAARREARDWRRIAPAASDRAAAASPDRPAASHVSSADARPH